MTKCIIINIWRVPAHTHFWKNTEEIQLANKCLKRYSNSLKTITNFKLRTISYKIIKKISCNELRWWENRSPYTQ